MPRRPVSLVRALAIFSRPSQTAIFRTERPPYAERSRVIISQLFGNNPWVEVLNFPVSSAARAAFGVLAGTSKRQSPGQVGPEWPAAYAPEATRSKPAEPIASLVADIRFERLAAVLSYGGGGAILAANIADSIARPALPPWLLVICAAGGALLGILVALRLASARSHLAFASEDSPPRMSTP